MTFGVTHLKSAWKGNIETSVNQRQGLEVMAIQIVMVSTWYELNPSLLCSSSQIEVTRLPKITSEVSVQGRHRRLALK